MHQDAYSKEIGEDGEPLWAIVPPPTQLLSGPSDDSRRLTGPVLNAGFSFFADDPATDGRPLQDAYIQAVQVMVRRVLGNPTVLGYEAFNEPVVLSQDDLTSFHQTFADGVHAIDRDAPVLFEPLGTAQRGRQAFLTPTPWSNGPAIYAPHIYTAWFSVPSQNGWESEDAGALVPSMAAANTEAMAWATPLFVTEFGCDVSNDKGTKWISAELDLQDQWLASSTAWEFSGAARGASTPTTRDDGEPEHREDDRADVPARRGGGPREHPAPGARGHDRALARDLGDRGAGARGVDVRGLREQLPGAVRRRAGGFTAATGSATFAVSAGRDGERSARSNRRDASSRLRDLHDDRLRRLVRHVGPVDGGLRRREGSRNGSAPLRARLRGRDAAVGVERREHDLPREAARVVRPVDAARRSTAIP